MAEVVIEEAGSGEGEGVEEGEVVEGAGAYATEGGEHGEGLEGGDAIGVAGGEGLEGEGSSRGMAARSSGWPTLRKASRRRRSSSRAS